MIILPHFIDNFNHYLNIYTFPLGETTTTSAATTTTSIPTTSTSSYTTTTTGVTTTQGWICSDNEQIYDWYDQPSVVVDENGQDATDALKSSGTVYTSQPGSTTSLIIESNEPETVILMEIPEFTVTNVASVTTQVIASSGNDFSSTVRDTLYILFLIFIWISMLCSRMIRNLESYRVIIRRLCSTKYLDLAAQCRNRLVRVNHKRNHKNEK